MKRRILVAAGFVAATLGCTLGPAAASCVTQNLGPFSMCVPADWQLAKGGHDSAAGMFKADGLSISYDFGLNSDPLRVPLDASEASETDVTIDGHPGRKVSFTRQSVHFSGLHLPSVRPASKGSFKLTVLAQAKDAARLRDAATAFQTIQFNR